MNAYSDDDYELIAKRCPSCESLVLVKVEDIPETSVKNNNYKCSCCDWTKAANIRN